MNRANPHRRRRRRHRRRRADDDPGPRRAGVPGRRAAPARLRAIGRPDASRSTAGRSRSARRSPRPSTASTSRSSRPAPTSRASSRPPRPPAARPSSTTRPRGGWTRRSRSSSARSTRDDLEGHEGIIANPNCSTMQLAPVLMALRDAVGLERVVVDTYQSVSGHRRRRDRRARGPDPGPRGRRAEGRVAVYPHPIAFNALPEIDVFLANGYTKEEWKVVTESRKILHLPDLRISCTAVRIPVFVSHSEAVHVETREPITPGAGARAVRRRARASSSRTTRRPSTTRSRPRPPAATRSSSAGSARTVSIPDDRGLAFWVVSDNLRKGAATNAVEIAEVLVERGWVRQRRRPAAPVRTGPQRATRGGHGVTDAERRAALEAIAAEVRVCTRCRLHETRTQGRAGRGRPGHRGRVRRRGPGLQRGPRRAGRSSAGPATSW